jgi:Zn-dependent peptidase ImmA (M78 family)
VTEVRVEDHPAFPFREGREIELERQVNSFLNAPPAGSCGDRLLREFVVLCHRYAFLERLIQGDILYQIPVHVEVVQPLGDETLDDQGELMAAHERNLLDWPGGLGSSLSEALDDIGIKVFHREGNGEGAEDASLPSALIGAFSFEGVVGPAMMVGVASGTPEAAFVAAHEYGHLIADVDPYRSRFCRWRADTLENFEPTFEEDRADRFARALLVPAESLRSALREIVAEGKGADVRGGPVLARLAALYEVPEALLRLRFSDLGVAIPAPSEQGSHLCNHSESTGALTLPERFFNLALAAYTERLFDVDILARFLRVTEDEAREVLEWARIPRRKPTAEE